MPPERIGEQPRGQASSCQQKKQTRHPERSEGSLFDPRGLSPRKKDIPTEVARHFLPRRCCAGLLGFLSRVAPHVLEGSPLTTKGALPFALCAKGGSFLLFSSPLELSLLFSVSSVTPLCPPRQSICIFCIAFSSPRDLPLVPSSAYPPSISFTFFTYSLHSLFASPLLLCYAHFVSKFCST
jgi:hypothetical protein